MTTIEQVPRSQSDRELAKIYIKQNRVVERGQLALWNIETKPRAQQSPAVHASRNRLRSTVMTEWLTLLLLVPAVVVPVVLLVGFAGCDRVFGLEHIDTPPPVPVVPVIVSADGESGTVITLTWMYSGSAADFEFERMKLPERTRETFTAATSPHHDDNNGQGLEPGTDYLYRVRAIGNDGEASEWSSAEPNVPGSTLPFQTTFAWTPEEQAAAIDNGLQATCIVQRIEGQLAPNGRLTKSGTRVILTLRASSANSATIDAIYISQPDPAPGKDPYDSNVDLTLVASGVPVPKNNSLPLPPIKYHLDAQQPLLIAIDFSAAVASGIKRVDGPPGASAYYKVATGEAANPDRTSFSAINRMYLVEKIEVA
jgi:hypothetical protein